ncbi:TPT-domain-containing protein [Rozella allomycis CSF55]|uniref:TPT-domain-containing protein n=1 Tax=Rozella allomycis (strain CSF55) TaxID=988480 RepID=A0A4P9YMN5_ROZAC|nr:TPT-domain-containing protein [Rozella allomycis CSF55]
MGIFDSPFAWICYYFLANLGLTIHNKWVLSQLHFDFPWLLTAIHIGVSGLGAFVTLIRTKTISAPLNARETIKLVLFSLLYTINIAISNVSLNYVSLSFHQIARSMTPFFTVLIELLWFTKFQKMVTYLSLLPVVIGVIFSTIGESKAINFDSYGCILTFIGVFLSALKGIATNRMMSGNLKLHPLELLHRLAPLAFVQCIIYAYCFGEIDNLKIFLFGGSDSISFGTKNPQERTALLMKLVFNGLLAFWLNYVSFTANKKTSALSMTVAGNCKQAFSIILAIYIFATPVSAFSGVGIFITLLGGAWYSNHNSPMPEDDSLHSLENMPPDYRELVQLAVKDVENMYSHSLEPHALFQLAEFGQQGMP